jgi:hypothetical protein
VNQASMFFTAVLMLAGAGWYVMASTPPAPAEKPGYVKAAPKAPLVARAPVPEGSVKDRTPVGAVLAD